MTYTLQYVAMCRMTDVMYLDPPAYRQYAHMTIANRHLFDNERRADVDDAEIGSHLTWIRADVICVVVSELRVRVVTPALCISYNVSAL